jgi:hypothetical protein
MLTLEKVVGLLVSTEKTNPSSKEILILHIPPVSMSWFICQLLEGLAPSFLSVITNNSSINI